MIIRDYISEDLPHIKEIVKRQNLGYPFPDMEKMICRRIGSDGGRVVLAVACKPTADAYLILDPQWQTPGLRLAALKAIHEDIQQLVSQMNIVQVHAWIPPVMVKSLGRRLVRDFGWWHTDWSCFVKEVE